MITTAQARTAYQRQNTDTSETFSTARNALQPGTEVEIEEEAPVTAQSRVVEWTALGVLSSSWIEYARRTSSPGDPRLWQVEWFTWSLLLIITHLVHLIRSYGNEDLARQISFFDSSKFTVGHLNVLLVAVMNCVAHLLDLHYDLRCVLPIISVTTCATLFLTPQKEQSSWLADPDRSQWDSSSPVVSRRSLNVAIAAAIPSTILLLTPEAVATGPGSSGIRATSFLLCQTIMYLALSGKVLDLPNKKLLEYPSKLLNALSLSSMMLWTLIMMMSGLSESSIRLSTIGLVLARSLQWLAIISISITGYPITASIISTVGASIGSSFASSMSGQIGKLSIVAVMGILHIVSSLPSHRPARKYLLFLMLLPSWSLIRQTHVNFTTRFDLHPIEALVEDATANFAHMVGKQSSTLHEAVAEYKRRYKRPPPPHFDTWYQMAAKANAIPLIDEFDTLMQQLEPFWGVPPSVIRARIDSAWDNQTHTRRVHKFEIRNHRWVSNATDIGRYEYVGEEMRTWLKPEHLVLLPNMTWAQNFWDEPRVYAPFDAVQQAMANTFQPLATEQQMVLSGDRQTMISGSSVDEVQWLKLEHRNAWEAMRLACAVDSPARSPFLASSRAKDTTSNGLSFITDMATHLDFCVNPELAKSHGFVLAPAAFDMTHSLIPLFSSCVPSIANDIIFPPAYTGERFKDGRYEYDPSTDIAWEDKRASIYWKGSSTGGWATSDNWQQLHRQRLSLKFTEAESSDKNVTLLRQSASTASKKATQWLPYEAPLASMADKFDIHIAGELVLCGGPESKKNNETGGCYEETQGLKRADLGAAEEAWDYKYVLDIDGNGYSGRFLRLLMSNSVPIKMTVFKEWNSDWIMPWVHYIPAKQDREFSDLPEIINFLTSERGDAVGKRVAGMGQEWTNKIMTKEALRLWFLRLLMEYGRLVNDDRDHMNFIP